MLDLIDKLNSNLRNSLKQKLIIDGAFLSFTVFILSLILFNYYLGGDLCYYRSAYAAVQDRPLSEAFFFYRKELYSADVFHFALIWILSGLLSHDQLMATLNALLALLLYVLLIKNGIGRLLAVALILFNYYFWVVAIPAERLKIALIFVAGFYLTRSLVLRWIFLFLGILSHASVAILFIPFFSVMLSRRKKLFGWRIGLSQYGIFLVAIIVAYAMGENVVAKILWYANEKNVVPSAILPTILLGILALCFSRRSFIATIPAFVVISLLILVISADRLNMFSLLITLGYIADGKSREFHLKFLNYDFRGVTLAFIVVSLFAKSMVFTSNIYHDGTGFGLVTNSC